MNKTRMNGGNYAHNLSRTEVESIVNKLRDREPTPAWVNDLNMTLAHFQMNQSFLVELAIKSDKRNMLGRPYRIGTLQNMIAGYRDNHTWTKNGQKTINDHLDILVDYLSKPGDGLPKKQQIAQTEEEPKTLLQRLEESGRKPFHPKANHINVDEPQPGESWADYGNRLAQRVENAKKTIAESISKSCESIVTLVEKKPVKVKLTKVHIIRR